MARYSARQRALCVAASGGIGLLALVAGTSVATAEYIPPRVDHSCPTPPPVVGESAAVNKEHGEVSLGVFVTARGRPKKIRLVHSSGFDDLDNAAFAAAASWHYTPAVRDGGNIPDWMGLKIDFGPRETGASLKAASDDEARACAR